MLTALCGGKDYLPEKLREQKDDIAALTLDISPVCASLLRPKIWIARPYGKKVEFFMVCRPVPDDQWETMKVQNGSHHIKGSSHMKSSRDTEVVEIWFRRGIHGPTRRLPNKAN